MKNKFIHLLITIVFLTSCGVNKVGFSFSESLYKESIKLYNNKTAKETEKQFKRILNDLFKKDLLSFVDFHEPLFIVNGWDIETDETYSTIWNSKGQLTFLIYKKDYQISDEPYYDKNLKELIQEWNVGKIKDNEKMFPINGALSIDVKSVSFRKGRIKDIKFISFEQYSIQNLHGESKK